MRKEYSKLIEDSRILTGNYRSKIGDRHGAFQVPCPTGAILSIIVGPGSRWKEERMLGEPWDHVSVSLPGRCPTWDEMSWVKDEFFEDEECVIQYHPPRSKYINRHRYVLHLWKPCESKILMPPMECV